jgi:hypothetical protein
LAHELNNPASAAARGAALLGDALGELVEASHARGAANLSSKQLEAIASVRSSCMHAGRGSESPLERADREDALIEWLERHGADRDTGFCARRYRCDGTDARQASGHGRH